MRGRARRTGLAAALAAACGLAVATGCQCGGADGEGGDDPERPSAPTGTIVGIVRLAEGSQIPAYVESPTQIDGRPPLPDSCTPPRQSDRTPVVVAEESGGLTNLSVVVTGEDETRWPRPGEPATHEVHIRDCRLTPSIVVATRGDRLRLVNDAPENPFFVDLGDGMMQYRTEPREITLEQGGIRTIQCGFAAPCGRTELITLYHPIHGTSGADGRFRIEHVPADEPVRVTAWHPLFAGEEAFTTTTVGAGETVEVELTLRAPPAPVPPPPVPPGAEGEASPESEPGHPEDRPDPGAPF